jgi:hypothetical protein
MALVEAVNYRKKAYELREQAASAPSQTLRDQLAALADQYDGLALSAERDFAVKPLH